MIGLLQIPAFLLINTALGASSSYVTLAASLAQFFDPAIGGIEYAAKHLNGDHGKLTLWPARRPRRRPARGN